MDRSRICALVRYTAVRCRLRRCVRSVLSGARYPPRTRRPGSQGRTRRHSTVGSMSGRSRRGLNVAPCYRTGRVTSPLAMRRTIVRWCPISTSIPEGVPNRVSKLEVARWLSGIAATHAAADLRADGDRMLRLAARLPRLEARDIRLLLPPGRCSSCRGRRRRARRAGGGRRGDGERDRDRGGRRWAPDRTRVAARRPSNSNYVAGQSIANLVTATLSSTGRSVYAHDVHVIADMPSAERPDRLPHVFSIVCLPSQGHAGIFRGRCRTRRPRMLMPWWSTSQRHRPTGSVTSGSLAVRRSMPVVSNVNYGPERDQPEPGDCQTRRGRVDVYLQLGQLTRGRRRGWLPHDGDGRGARSSHCSSHGVAGRVGGRCPQSMAAQHG